MSRLAANCNSSKRCADCDYAKCLSEGRRQLWYKKSLYYTYILITHAPFGFNKTRGISRWAERQSASAHGRLLAAQRLRVFNLLQQNTNISQSRGTSGQTTVAAFKTQTAPFSWGSGRRLYQWNKCKQAPAWARTSKQPLRGIFNYNLYINYRD
jgi:hypothetical protein